MFAFVRTLLRRSVAIVGIVVAVVVLIAVGYVAWVFWTTSAGIARVDGTQGGMPVDGPVTIARDDRGVPHVRAGSVHDLFVAEGYAMASDRLFQMDTTRRFVYGQLAEELGGPLVRVDRRMRRYDIRRLATDVYAHASPDERALLSAFADGVNAAARTQPTPPEYRALFRNFEPWQPQDALAVGFATVLDLDDVPDAVVIRDWVRREVGDRALEAFYPLTDPRYDVPTDGASPGPIAALPALGGAMGGFADADIMPAEERAPVGSNGWVVGADRTTVRRALLANDPHLDLGIPGIWWLFEGSAPGMHIAGAALAGTPGVTLGHNEHLAWGVTAGETAAMRVLKERRDGDRVFEHGRWAPLRHRIETITVRFGADVRADIRENDRGVVIADDQKNHVAYIMQWRMRTHPVSTLAPFFHLLTARTAADGVAAMRALPEPALNTFFADDDGNVAYHFAGGVPMEPAWGRWAVDGDAPEPAFLSYDAAPHVAPSRSAIVVTSNNRSSGAGSPRLAPFWPPPYRAYEVERALRSAADPQGKLTPDAIAAVQRDATSPAEAEFASLVLASAARSHAADDASLAPIVNALRSFDGSLVPESRGATAVVALRLDMLGALAKTHLDPTLAGEYPATGPGFEVVLRALRERPHGWVTRDDYDAFVRASLQRTQQRLGGDIPAFGSYAAQPITHNLAAFGFTLWNGPTYPGRGGSFAPAVQWRNHAQSFRAVWIAGDWDNGTIDIGNGESGEPGSPHYTDQAAAWVQFARTPLPFTDKAVQDATRATLTLTH